MEVCRRSSWLLLLFGVALFTTSLPGVQGDVELEGPSESECRPYIEKALKELEIGDDIDDTGTIDLLGTDQEDLPTVEITTDDDEQNIQNDEEIVNNPIDNAEQSDEEQKSDEDNNSNEVIPNNDTEDEVQNDDGKSSQEDKTISEEEATDQNKDESVETNTEQNDSEESNDSSETKENNDDDKSIEESADVNKVNNSDEDTKENTIEDDKSDDKEESDDDDETANNNADDKSEEQQSEEKKNEEEQVEKNSEEKADSSEDNKNEEAKEVEAIEDTTNDSTENVEDKKSDESKEDNELKENSSSANDDSKEDEANSKSAEDEEGDSDDDSDNASTRTTAPEEELSQDIEIPTDLRPRSHVEQLLKLDDESHVTENIINRVAEITLRELKKLYENAIKPLENVYKYRDLSNRHFGDSEIFSKPLILFMGPWSGGKSSIINYLVNNEYNETALRTGAEPSPAYFNILLHGDEPEIIDGTQLTTDFTFSGLQKFGQGLEERLRGVKLPSPLLEKVDIVEIPGILEVRKQVSRVFPFNDACQWFIDRADIIFLVYDPSKLDVGPETEAILDQLKGREHQTRIVLNKADQVKPEELMRVQGALIWNISPLMSSAQPPVMYTLSLWSRPYESWAPIRLLQAQERAFLRDLRLAIDRRIENKIASARRFAVRVRNHAKMVDCYLTTYYNHKSLFGNRKQVADEIIDHPQDYHIYEGLSTLTNISRYDLPDPDVYRDFFKLNALYDFQQLSATCTYFRGCPINRLDIAIAYDLPELIGKHKRLVENALSEANLTPSPTPGS